MEDLTQLWFEFKLQLQEMEEESVVFKELTALMSEMEQRMKGGELYK